MRKVLLTASLLAAVPAAASAESFYGRYIFGPDGIPPCYARTYTADHLAAHPKQKVTQFFLVRSDMDDGGPPKSFDVGFGFRLKGSSDVFAAEAGCVARGDGATCSVEGDGGGFSLAPRPDGLLVSVENRLELEGMESFSPNLYDSDDRAFRLYVSPPEACLFDIFGGDGPDGGGGRPEGLTPSIERPG